MTPARRAQAVADWRKRALSLERCAELLRLAGEQRSAEEHDELAGDYRLAADALEFGVAA